MPTQAPRERAADRAYAALRGDILQGRLSPGTMLSENDLAADLAMSRTPVRAALTRLQDEGWVAIYPQRGVLVRELTETEVRESAEVRHALETAGVHRSIPGMRTARVAWFASNVGDQAAALRDNDFAAFTELALALHRGFVELADNTTLLDLYDRLQDRQYLSIIRSSGRIVAHPDDVLAEHRTLIADALAGDWAGFATHLAEHQELSHGLI